ncbi:hypothetical protein HCU67_01370 [Muricauda sp. DJ-13]|uniref:EF-hand domain-containing protein n=1 Tax=Croceivirga thetidis TaxID=2721623 RepID=A0ABX1GL06_9FLAO|nr:hypothetical protein [Croceivirga thetidis]
MLKVLGDNTNSAAKIIELIKEPLSKVEEPKKKTTSKSDINLTSFKARFLFSNIKKFYTHDSLMHDNTRLEFLNTTLCLNNSNIKIYSIDRIENELETIDLGTLERTNEVTFNSKIAAELGAKINNGNSSNTVSESTTGTNNSDTQNEFDASETPTSSVLSGSNQSNNTTQTDSTSNSSEVNQGVSAELGYNNTENIKENLTLKKSTIKTSFSFTPKTITVAQRGRPLAGITDNVVLTATMKFKEGQSANVFDFSNMFNEYDLNEANKIDVKRYNVGYIQCNETEDMEFSFDVAYDGVVRGVKNLEIGNNIGEFDDRVKFYRIADDDISQLEEPTISKYDYCKKVFEVKANVESKDSIKNYILKIDRYGYQEKVYLFEDDDPVLFYGWLNRILEKPTVKLLQTKKFRLYFESIGKDESTGKKRRIYLTKEALSKNELKAINTINAIDLIEKPKKESLKPIVKKPDDEKKKE